ncbi:MAG: AsmA family protein [Bryobacterales bacterium]|nr:AsmA family protein [Bryobacterales bacterium]
MKKILTWLAVVSAILLASVAGIGLAARSLVAGAGKDSLVRALETRLGVPVTVAGAELDLEQLLRLRPAILLKGISAGNPPGFRGKHLLEAESVSVQLELLPLFRNSLLIHSIAVERPRIAIERSAAGITNLEKLLKPPAAPASGAAKTESGSVASPSHLAIEELAIREAEIELPGGMKLTGLNLRLLDFNGDSCRIEAATRFFGGGSNLSLRGHIGPFGPASLPLEGKLLVTVVPDEIPAAVREREFGKLFAAPGAKARVSLDAEVKGDAHGTLSGPAKLTFADLLIGKDKAHVMPLSGQAPLTFSVERLTSGPSYHVRMAGAALKLGKGEWSGGLDLRVRGSATSGSSTGKIRNVEINEFLNSLTEPNDKVSGILEISPYSLQFRGGDADALRNSLNGTAKFSITQGKFAALDFSSSIQRATSVASALLQPKTSEAQPAAGSTAFSTVSGEMKIAAARIELDSLNLESPSLGLTGHGTIGFDHSLQFSLEARMKSDLADLMSRLTKREDVSQTGIPVEVSGTIEVPRIRPNVAKLMPGTVKGAVDSLRKLFNRK